MIFCLKKDGEGESAVPISGGWNNYGQHAFTTGRRHISAPKTRPKGISQTLKVIENRASYLDNNYLDINNRYLYVFDIINFSIWITDIFDFIFNFDIVVPIILILVYRYYR